LITHQQADELVAQAKRIADALDDQNQLMRESAEGAQKLTAQMFELGANLARPPGPTFPRAPGD
jgi:hypothetical protein